MRKIYFSLLFMFIGLSMSMGQSERVVLVEEFTNASCGPCAGQNPGFNAVLAEVADQNVISIKYQTEFPGTDPMNARNPSEVATRWNAYSATSAQRGVPEAHFDGSPIVGANYVGAPANATPASLTARQAITSPVAVSVSHTISEDLSSMTVQVNIDNEGTEAWDGSAMKLRTALTEREIIFVNAPGSNGELDFYNVFRSFINEGGAAGKTLDVIEAGSTMTIDYDVAIPSFYDLRELEVVAFIQNDAGNEIINAGLSKAIELSNITDGEISDNTDKPTDYCAESVDLTFELTNNGDVEINSIEVVTSLNGVVSEPITIDGLSVGAGASETLSAGAVDLVAGTTNYIIALSSVNGAEDINVLNNLTLSDLINKFASDAAAVDEGFESYGFDDEGAFTDECDYALGIASVAGADAGLTQSLGGYGESNKSVLVYFYNWNPAVYDNVGYMAYGEMDLSSMNEPILTFDRACADYTTPTNDGMEIEISTDCGVTWTSIHSNYGATLRTAAASGSPYWANAGDWVTDTVSLADYANDTNVSMRYKFVSAYGNSLFIDNILISESPTGVKEVINEDLLTISPNPASEYVNLSMDIATPNDVTLIVTDISGKVVDQVNYGSLSGNKVIRYETNNLSNGMYLFKLTAGTDAIVRKVSILK